ncbi:MAG: hypothetical protein Kow00121_33230 [Elainellaceae cyanobacterium]
MNINRQQAIKQTVQMHQDNLRKNVQRRLEAARSRGDEDLIRQLEAEARYIG